MLRPASRAGRYRPLALTLAALAALAACADEPPATAPNVPGAPDFTVADVYTVTNTSDNGLGSLRWALSWTTGGETIRFDPGLAGQTITLDSALVIWKTVTIEGPAGKGITISGGGKGRVFEMHTSGTDQLRNLSITGGSVRNGSGGAIRADWGVLLDHSTVYGNEADTVGAIRAQFVALYNSTVSSNTSTIAYPAILAGYEVKLVNSTVAYNVGGGVTGSAAVLRNSVISNSVDGKNCALGTNAVTYEGMSISNDDTCGGPGVTLIADPKLAALADNGGPGTTHALLAGSPAIDAGTDCTLGVDQRYVARDAGCDLGAFEFTDRTSVALTIDASAAVSQSNGWAVVTGTTKCSRDETFTLAVELKQVQKVGRETTDVHAAATVPINCTTGIRPWSASMYPTVGAFRTGAAQATATTTDAPAWVAPASTSAGVKLYWGRK